MSMKSQLFHYFDPNKPGYGLHPIYWIDGAKVATYMTESAGDDSWRQDNETRIGTDPSFFKHWQHTCIRIADNVVAGQPVQMDLEHIPYVNADNTTDYRFAAELARTIRLMKPGVQLWFDGPMLHLNIEDVIASKVKFNTKQLGELPQYIDGVTMGVYLLGRGKYAERDLNYISEIRRITARAFPGKKYIFAVWGQYHDNWNKTPEEWTIEPEILLRYAKAVTRYQDNVIVFWPVAPRDDYFISELKKRSEP